MPSKQQRFVVRFMGVCVLCVTCGTKTLRCVHCALSFHFSALVRCFLLNERHFFMRFLSLWARTQSISNVNSSKSTKPKHGLISVGPATISLGEKCVCAVCNGFGRVYLSRKRRNSTRYRTIHVIHSMGLTHFYCKHALYYYFCPLHWNAVRWICVQCTFIQIATIRHPSSHGLLSIEFAYAYEISLCWWHEQ